jgi:phosphoglycerol transferase MdoB-like AlkP superfamily enzyme
MPTLMNEPFTTSLYSGNRIESIASILKPWGYKSMFFHGGKNGTMGFDLYAHIAGFDNYYGLNEYNNTEDYDGKWGIYDEEFLQYTARKLNTTKTPFVAAIFTLSSHHPYNIPERYKNRFRGGKLPIQRAISYADYSLKRFFETAAKMPWFKNTIFVITADHTSEAYYDYYKNGAGLFAIPLIFYKPGSNLIGVDFQEAQQADIMPSLLGLLGIKKSFIAYGNNLFAPNSPRFSVSFYNNNYQLYKDDYLLHFDGQKTTGFYDLQADSLLTRNLVNEDSFKKDSIESYIKSIVQSYNYRVINNMLVIDF